MKKAMLLLLAVTMLSCSTYTLYDREVVGVVTEVLMRPGEPFEYEVLITSYEGGERHYKLRTNNRHEIGQQVNVPMIISCRRNKWQPPTTAKAAAKPEAKGGKDATN